MDLGPDAGPSVAHRCRPQRRSRTGPVGPVPLRPAPCLRLDAVRAARHRRSADAAAAFRRSARDLPGWHRDPRAGGRPFAGVAVRHRVRRLPGSRERLRAFRPLMSGVNR